MSFTSGFQSAPIDDPKTKPAQIRKGRQDPASLKVDDIPGAQVGTTGALRTMKYTKRPNLFNNGDIEGSSPKPAIHKEVNKHNTFNIDNSDIEYSTPQSCNFKRSSATDPNNPQYTLPTCIIKPITPPRQINQSLCVCDIEGATNSYGHKRPKATRDNVSCLDIDGAQANTRGEVRKHRKYIPKPPLDDEGAKDAFLGLKTTRVIDPLNPVYPVSVPSGEDPSKWCGDIDGSRPRSLPKARSDVVALRTDDIAGAQPSTLRKAILRDDALPVACSPNQPLRRNRCLDPLNPSYAPL